MNTSPNTVAAAFNTATRYAAIWHATGSDYARARCLGHANIAAALTGRTRDDVAQAAIDAAVNA